MHPAQLSYELRNETSPDLTRRRWIIGLSLLGVAAGKIVGAYQTGILRRLPDLPFWPFDSNRVNASDYAYSRGQMPDGLPMIVNLGITACLAGAGGKYRAEDNPALPIATTAKAIADLAVTAKLGQEEWRENKALCAYCQAATVASAAVLVLSLPETIRALKSITGPKPAQPARRTVRAIVGRTRAMMNA
ncbi:MAG TPA: vitamin K epoxide reductase family protein [Tepidisphaeraceae bacterium]|jgi:hypothetical protein|nr:vitamin K epoxide reductase family protein [Tepidisphaeraceae bacterium]